MSVFRHIYVGGFIFESAQDNLTATAGGGQTNAFQLTAEINRFTTVATAGDSSMLPPATGGTLSNGGLSVIVINHGAKAMQVYGQPGDKINDVASATGVSQMPGSLVLYVCTSPGNWYAEGLGTGYSGSLQTFQSFDGITAHAGGGQGSATALPGMYNRVTTVASAGDSTLLPVSSSGMEITVTNAAAVNSMNVFPASGEQINAAGANAAFAVAAAKTATFYCATAGQWHTILSA